MTHALETNPAVIVLSGRPGSGKTVAASQIVLELAEQGEHVVWARVTADDREYRLFWRRLFGALVEADVAPEDGRARRLFSEGAGIPDAEAVTHALAECSQPLTLAVDDLHQLQEDHLGDVATSVLHALEHVPGLRAIVTTRRPIPHLTGVEARVRVPVVELIEDDLVFTAPDVEQLLRTRLPQLAEDRVHGLAESVMEESAGWPIAAHAAVVEHDIARPGRPAPAPGSYIRSYVHRMLDECGTENRQALIASGLVPEVSPRVLAAMLGTTVEHAGEMLEASPGAELAYWTDEHGERWYRHHDLVRDELAGRAERELDPETLTAWYRGAAVTLADTNLFEAVRAALRAGAWDMLSEMLVMDSYTILTGPSTRLSPWLKDIPADARDSYPVLAAFALLDEYAGPNASPEKILRDLDELANRTLATESAKQGLPGATAVVLRMVAARVSGNQELAIAMAESAQSLIDELSDDDARRYRGALALAATQRPITFLHADRFVEAERALQWIEEAPEQFPDYSRAHATALAAFGAALRGDIPWARQLIDRCARIDPCSGWHDGRAGAEYRVAAAIVALERGDHRAAEEHIAALGETRDMIDHWPHVLVVETLAIDIRSGPEEALAHMDWKTARFRHRGLLQTARDKFAKIRARLEWHAGRIAPRPDGALESSLETVYHALGWNDLSSARTILDDLLQGPSTTEHLRERAEVLLLKADVALLERDEQTASTTARQAADLVERHQLGLPLRALTRASLEHLRKYAPQLQPELGSVGSGARIVPLSTAERRTITAVAVHRTVAAAAGALHVSTHTVKFHLKSVYRKLGVRDRAEALKVAEEAGLLDESLLSG